VARYFPEIFDAPDLQRAKRIILTEEGNGADTEARWALETPYAVELISRELRLGPDSVVLDYGCGIGRVAKALIEAFGCSVIGTDISPAMRSLAPGYVGSDRFLAVAPEQFDLLLRGGLRVHAAIAVWVLQHCFRPADDIERIRKGLIPGGRCFVLNMPKRAVPARRDGGDEGEGFLWATDGVDIAALLRASFAVMAEGVPDKPGIPNMADAGAYWMALRRG
jgi:SAM-dependent methyltransferase